MGYGDIEDELIRQQEKGQRVRALENKPYVFDDLVEVWNSFSVLHDRRIHTDSGPNAIPIVEIKAWFEIKEFDEDEKMDFLDLILKMDSHYIKWAYKKRK